MYLLENYNSEIKAFILTTAVKAVKPFCWNRNYTALLYAFKGKLLWPKFIVWTISNSCITRRLITLDKLVMIMLICDQGCSELRVYDWVVLFQAAEGCRRLQVMSRTHLQSTTPSTTTNLRPLCSLCQAARATLTSGSVSYMFIKIVFNVFLNHRGMCFVILLLKTVLIFCLVCV